MKYEDKLELGENSMQGCSLCGRKIPQNIQRVSFEFKTNFGKSYKRLCGYCIKKLYEELDLKAIEAMEEKIVEGEI